MKPLTKKQNKKQNKKKQQQQQKQKQKHTAVDYNWSFNYFTMFFTSQLQFTCSKSAMEAQKNTSNLFKVNNEGTRTNYGQVNATSVVGFTGKWLPFLR